MRGTIVVNCRYREFEVWVKDGNRVLLFEAGFHRLKDAETALYSACPVLTYTKRDVRNGTYTYSDSVKSATAALGVN